jgi:type VI secretion system protein VasI
MRYFFAFAIATLGHPVFADVSNCTSIESSIDRLECYDKEAGYSPKPSVALTGAGDWLVRTETSKIDDSTNVFLSLVSEDHTSCRFKPNAHSIHIACRENTTSLWIGFGECFMSSVQGKGRVTYRLDTDSAKNRNFRESNNNMALGLWDGGQSIPFIKEMLGHEKMFVRATPFSDSAVSAEYKISGLDEAIEPLREACNW